MEYSCVGVSVLYTNYNYAFRFILLYYVLGVTYDCYALGGFAGGDCCWEPPEAEQQRISLPFGRIM